MEFMEHLAGLAGVPENDNALHACHQTIHTSDLWQHERVLTGWNQAYDQLSKGKFSGSFTEAFIGDIQLFEETTTQAVFETGPGRAGVVALGVFASIEGNARWRGHAVGIDHVTALSDHANLELSTPPDCTMLSVSVPVGLLSAGADQTGLDAEALLMTASNHVYSPALASLLRQRLGTALRTMTHHPSRFALRETRDQLVSELVGLVDEYFSLATTEGGAPDAKKALQVVARAREYIEANPDRPITVLDLCARTCTSRRTLQYCFTQVVGMSPAAYLKTMRLNGLQRDLVHSTGGKTIAEAAAAWGFWHMSQLSLDYRRLFGELPSETVRHAARRRNLH